MTTTKQKTLILIAGPTAVGKTALSLDLARHFGTDILSADSRQCYREMTIGTAKPSTDELKLVKHYFINSHAITEKVNAGIFEKFGLTSLEHIFQQQAKAILCGGTGLYIKALLEGIDTMPEIPETTRAYVRNIYDREGLAGLQQALQKKDPIFYHEAEQKNPHRLMRALEVYEATGLSIMNFRKNTKVSRPFNIIRIGLELSKEQLLRNITLRTKRMLQSGLIDEVKNLLPYRNLKAMQTVGYTEVFRFLDGQNTLADVENEIILHTRQYAKRQMTWFKKDPLIRWFPATDADRIIHYIQQETANFA